MKPQRTQRRGIKKVFNLSVYKYFSVPSVVNFCQYVELPEEVFL